jgi:hypothetical protein
MAGVKRRFSSGRLEACAPGFAVEVQRLERRHLACLTILILISEQPGAQASCLPDDIDLN